MQSGIIWADIWNEDRSVQQRLLWQPEVIVPLFYDK